VPFAISAASKSEDFGEQRMRITFCHRKLRDVKISFRRLKSSQNSNIWLVFKVQE